MRAHRIQTVVSSPNYQTAPAFFGRQGGQGVTLASILRSEHSFDVGFEHPSHRLKRLAGSRQFMLLA